VVAVACNGESPLTQIAKDFGICEACLHRCLKLADVEDDVRPGVTVAEAAELRDARKRIRLFDQ
jgi:transposase